MEMSSIPEVNSVHATLALALALVSTSIVIFTVTIHTRKVRFWDNLKIIYKAIIKKYWVVQKFLIPSGEFQVYPPSGMSYKKRSLQADD